MLFQVSLLDYVHVKNKKKSIFFNLLLIFSIFYLIFFNFFYFLFFLGWYNLPHSWVFEAGHVSTYSQIPTSGSKNPARLFRRPLITWSRFRSSFRSWSMVPRLWYWIDLFPPLSARCFSIRGWLLNVSRKNILERILTLYFHKFLRDLKKINFFLFESFPLTTVSESLVS